MVRPFVVISIEYDNCIIFMALGSSGCYQMQRDISRLQISFCAVISISHTTSFTCFACFFNITIEAFEIAAVLASHLGQAEKLWLFIVRIYIFFIIVLAQSAEVLLDANHEAIYRVSCQKFVDNSTHISGASTFDWLWICAQCFQSLCKTINTRFVQIPEQYIPFFILNLIFIDLVTDRQQRLCRIVNIILLRTVGDLQYFLERLHGLPFKYINIRIHMIWQSLSTEQNLKWKKRDLPSADQCN